MNGHPALLPIAEAVFHLHEQNTLEQQILLLLTLNLLEATAPKCRYDTVEVELSVEGQPFTASGMTERFAGWRDVERSKRSMLNLPENRCRLAPLPPLKQRDSLVILSTESKESRTKPPQRYTEATLLQAMEEKGLGTPATRAQIIENLVWNPETGRGFVTRGKQVGGKPSDTKHFYPTKNGMTLISLLPDVLKSPSMTADWEKQLTDIAQGTASAEPFDASIRAFVRELVEESQLADTWSYEQFSIDSDALEDDLIGFVDIPSIDVQLPLYLGATDTHLAQGVAVMGQTSIPIGGTNTNSVIAGHRGYRGAPYFREIESIQVGDMVSITNPFEVLTYQVTETKIIAPDDMESILIQDGKDMVTLLTCHPYRSHGKFRYVVYCERVEQPVSTSQTAKSEEQQNNPFSFFSSAPSSTPQAADSSQSDIALERTVRMVCALLLLILVLSLLIPAKKS